jgi:transketolase
VSQRDRFYALLNEALRNDERVEVVLAEIGAGALPHHPRIHNVGIREQLMIGVAAGLALEGRRAVAHSYAPFLVERPFEQIKIDFAHQGVGAVLVSVGASYDSARSGRTHQAPEDVAVLSSLPGWTIDVPGHPDEVGPALADALAGDHCVYLRLTEETNAAARDGREPAVVRRGSDDAPLIVAVGPTLGQTLEATADLDVTVAYLTRVRPFPAAAVREALHGETLVLVEPYLAGTSTADAAAALSDRPHRLLALGVAKSELRRYGTIEEHRAAHGLDAAGIRASLERYAFSSRSSPTSTETASVSAASRSR